MITAAVTAAALPRFCSVCGDWFDGAAMVLHCARPAPLPVPADVGDLVRIGGQLFPLVPLAAPRAETVHEHEHPEHVYAEDLPAVPGYYVYRLWDAAGWPLYVGRTGDNGPRRLAARLGEHRRTKAWWPDVARIDAAASGPLDYVTEETMQIGWLTPAHNIRDNDERTATA